MNRLLILFVGIGVWILSTLPVSADASLQQLIDETPINGELILENKQYDGNVEIKKPITIIGKKGTMIRGDGKGNVVLIKASNVTLKNLKIEHGSLNRSSDEEYSGIRTMGEHNQFINLVIHDVYHGLYINSSKYTLVKNIKVTGQGTGKLGSQGNGIQLVRTSNNIIEDSTISNTRDGIYVEYADKNEIRNNFVSETRYGLHYMYSNDNVFYKNRFNKNTGGAAIMHSQNILLKENQFSFNQGSRSFGLIIQTSTSNTVLDNEFYLNQRGIYLEQSTQNKIEGNKFFHNDIGVELWTTSTSQVFTKNHFKQNVANVLTIGAESYNQWNQNGAGNYWGTELSVLDLDQNQVGDSPVEYKSSLYKLVEENELAYLFLKSPAITIYEKINEVLSTQKVMVVDEFPLIEVKQESGPWGLLVIPAFAIFGWIFTKKRRRRSS
ncbi:MULTISPECIES: nitrous oxide reductase family maturation protein NosD [unclassified Mesobacillus]|uniref:nitrous oxide reductase family maturation protein NosD n=1 Tax=unclassified Mesobacillus TaxID=2675270 RepID=UPI00203A5F62|nr:MULTISPECIES: nitrous oxide reductase family maturation protein NosD [unclassified Mesobacillus]MCM3123662.1 nitrous oxide reductase family maturation protein NosD [Mesobacillus sp. MER 33]MCM3234323.1 nitrous oxide reductase family maturation protein NosD [Mesobacillus sp. MER 48]